MLIPKLEGTSLVTEVTGENTEFLWMDLKVTTQQN